MMNLYPRPTIGLLIANIVGEYCEVQCFSAHRMAIETHANLVIFTPFCSSAVVDDSSDYMKTFEFAGKENVDGIIICTGTMSHHMDNNDIKALLHTYSGLPMITLSVYYEGIPAILIDDNIGMQDLVRHFINDHGKKNIAFIKGTDGVIEAERRLTAYREALAEHSLPYDERFVVEGDFTFHSGKTAVEVLLDKRKLAPDVIIAANNHMILGAFQELQARGVVIPDDIGLGGFGNMTTVKDAEIPIATVRPPLDAQMRRAFGSILNMIKGVSVPMIQTLEALPMFRRSCERRTAGEKDGGGQGPAYRRRGRRAGNWESLTGYIASRRSGNLYFLNRFSTTTMTTMNTPDIEIIKTESERVMAELDVTSCFISLYNDGIPLLPNISDNPPDRAGTFFSYQDGRRKTASEIAGLYAARQLVPDKGFFRESRRTVFFSEICYHNEHYGFIILEMLSFDTFLFNLFRAQISNCFHNIFTHRELDQVCARLEKSNKDLNKTLDALKTTQSALVQSAKMASLGSLTAGIAHSLKNPLNFINNFSQMSIESIEQLKAVLEIYRQNPTGECLTEISNLVEDILDNSREVFVHGRHADVIVKEMLNQTRERMTIEECDINSIIKESVSLAFMAARSQNPDFFVLIVEDFSPVIPVIRANRSNLAKVFIDIIENALYAMKKKKENNDAYDPRLVMTTRFSEEAIVIDFKDNGTGIAPDIINNIYDPFFTTKPAREGNGIGLKNCYEVIVEGMNGEIDCDSKAGDFTVFTIKLKICQKKEAFYGSKHTHRR